MAANTKNSGIIDSEITLLKRQDTSVLGSPLALRNDDGSVMSVRVGGANTLVEFQVATPTLANSATTKTYVDAAATTDPSAILTVMCSKDFAAINLAAGSPGGPGTAPWTASDWTHSFNPITAGVDIPAAAIVTSARIIVGERWNGAGATGVQVALGTTAFGGGAPEHFVGYADTNIVSSTGTFPKNWTFPHWDGTGSPRDIYFNFKVLSGTLGGAALNTNGQVTFVLNYVLAPKV